MFKSLALVYIAAGVRPSLRPITRVGVFPLASCLSCDSVAGVQGLPLFLFDFDILASFIEVAI
jgi:hypothetical protein